MEEQFVLTKDEKVPFSEINKPFHGASNLLKQQQWLISLQIRSFRSFHGEALNMLKSRASF